jgi:glycerophosphoryl diester phosphodiesterase
MHDGTVNRTTNGEGDVNSLTFSQIRNLQLDGSDNKHVYQIPTFTEAMQEAKGKILVDIDIKSAAVSELVSIIHKLDMGDQVLFFDSDFAILDSVKMLDSSLMVMPRAHSAEKLSWIIDRYHPPIIHIDPGFFTSEVVQAIEDGHARIWINALGKPDILAILGLANWSYASLVDGGANVIQTDRPAAMLKFLVKKEKHW